MRKLTWKWVHGPLAQQTRGSYRVNKIGLLFFYFLGDVGLEHF